jgi:eukaryotic-like serine/threonine-protein kinase
MLALGIRAATLGRAIGAPSSTGDGSNSAMAIPDNRVLGEKYRLIRQLDEGAMGSVWLAEHVSLSSPVAIKLISTEIAESDDGVLRFFREARTAAALRNPHVVQILDYGVEQAVPYIVMELLEGEPLSERLRRVGRLSPRETERVLRHVSRALSRAHDAGIVHRDLKPANIFIVSNEEEELIKLLDFGIAKARVDVLTASMASNTRTGMLLGTPFYMSPEHAEGSKSLDYRADIWGMGVVAYQCLLGALPFAGDTFGSLILSICSRPLPVPSQRGPVPAGFDSWFARACARDPAGRFQSAREAAADLRRLTEATPEAGGPVPRAASDAPRTEAPALPAARAASEEESLSPSSLVAQTKAAPVRAVARRRGALLGNRTALVGAALLAVGVLFFALRPQPANPVAAASDGRARATPSQRAKTGLHVSGEGPLRVFVDGAFIGPLPVEHVELEPGEHHLRVTGGPRYEDHEGRVLVESGHVTRVGPIELEVTRGLATIQAGNRAAEGAEVTLEIGSTRRVLPVLPARVEIDVSKPVRLIAKRPGFASVEQTLAFEDGQAEKTFEIHLLAPAKPAAAPAGAGARGVTRERAFPLRPAR